MRYRGYGWKYAVLDRTAASAQQRIASLVRKLLVKRAIAQEPGAEDDLSAGLSSLDLVNLMLSVEAEFGLKIPERDMTPANFRSIARIEALMTRLGADRQPAPD
jgi:acyl carrier protein